MALLRIREAQPLEGFKLRLTLTDCSTIEREVSRLLVGPVFEEIRRDPALFRSGPRRRRHSGMAEWRESLF